MSELQQLIKIVLATSTFALVLSLWVGGILLWASRRAAKTGRVRRRLGLDASADSGQRVLHLWRDGRDFTTTVPSVSAAGLLRRFDRMLHHADLPLTPWQAIVLLAGVLLLTIAFIVVLTGNIYMALGVAAGVLVVLRIYMASRIAKRETLFESQLVNALELAARSLRAGHPLLGAFQLISEEMSPPMSTVFAEICQRHGMGADLEQVLRDAGDESASNDMKLFATSVAIQIRTGGNLADLMERLALVIRDRIRVHRRARVLTAQTQLSKRILVALPFLMFLFLNIAHPQYMAPFYAEPTGKILLGIGIGLLVLGVWIMNRLAVIRY